MFKEKHPHAIRRILNEQNDELGDLMWDANGNLSEEREQRPSLLGLCRAGERSAQANLSQVNHFKEIKEYDHSRFLYWTEDNRLAAAVDPDYYSYYGYDHTGERTLKLTGKCSLLDINADAMSVAAALDNVTLYTSPYLVATNKGYTKHFYAGAERICAKRGGGGFDGMYPLLGSDEESQSRAQGLFESVCQETERDREYVMCDDPADELLGIELDPAAFRAKAEVTPPPQ